MNTERNTIFEELCVGFVLNSITKKEEQEFKVLLKSANEEQLQLFQDI